MQELAECPARPYAELIKSDIPGPSSSRSAHSAVLRSSPPSTMKGSPTGPFAAKPTKGELLAQLETMSQKPRSVKRKPWTPLRKTGRFRSRFRNWGRLPLLRPLMS